MDKDRVTGIEGFDIPKETECFLLEDSNIFYFNYKSKPNQIIRKIGKDGELDIERFFDFEENENLEMAPLSTLLGYYDEKSLDNNGKPGEPTRAATICFQGIIKIEDGLKIQIGKCDYNSYGGTNTNVGVLGEEEECYWYEDWQDEGNTIEDSLDIINNLEKEWSVEWATKGIFGADADDIY